MKSFITRHAVSATLLALACGLSASVAQAHSDASFMTKAAENGNTELEASRLAHMRSQNADVKAFAAMMMNDHSAISRELKQLAASKNVKLPEGPSITQAAELKLISATGSSKFDERYAERFGLRAHEDTIKLFEDAAQNAEDAEVKVFAVKTLPTLKHHLKMAQALASASN